jgi:hypothetical protein
VKGEGAGVGKVRAMRLKVRPQCPSVGAEGEG